MNLSRRGLLGMFAASAAATIITTPGLLMPVKSWRRYGWDDEYTVTLPPSPAGTIKFSFTPRHGDTVTIGNQTRVFMDIDRIRNRNILLLPSDMTREPVETFFRGIRIRVDESLAADEWRIG